MSKTKEKVAKVEAIVRPTEEELAMAADVELFGVLTGQKEFSDRTQVAIKTANNIQSRKSLRMRGESFGFRVAHTIARTVGDPELLKKYVMDTQPQIGKLLTAAV
jgi:hypothetical protein